MNLLFLTVELERNGTSDQPLSERARHASRVRQSRLRWVGLAQAVLMCATAAGCAGCCLAGADPLVPAEFDWLALSSDSGNVGAGDRASLEITSHPEVARSGRKGRSFAFCRPCGAKSGPGHGACSRNAWN